MKVKATEISDYMKTVIVQNQKIFVSGNVCTCNVCVEVLGSVKLAPRSAHSEAHGQISVIICLHIQSNYPECVSIRYSVYYVY